MFVSNRENMMKGFSLIEMMVVLAIIAILAAVAIPGYGSYKNRAIRAEAEQELMNVATVQEDHFNSYRKYTVTEADLEDFYGVAITGDHFKIDITGDTTAYLATAYVCYDLAGTACDSGNMNLTCTIVAGQEKPSCI